MMMKIRYSATTGTFYPYDVDYPVLPDDLIDVEESDQTRVLSRSPGETFSFDADGMLTIHPAAEVPFGQIAAAYLGEVRAIRESILNRLAGIGFGAMAANDLPAVSAIATAREALLDITKVPAVLAATDLAALKAAVLAEYRRIVMAAPTAVQKAFDGVDA